MYKLCIVIMCLALIIIGLIVYITVNDLPLKDTIEEQAETISNLEQLIENKELSWVATDMQISNLEQIIASKDELIVELQVKEQVLKDVKEILEYAITYIHFIQVVMQNNNLHYPEFIIESIMTDEFFENDITLE